VVSRDFLKARVARLAFFVFRSVGLG